MFPILNNNLIFKKASSLFCAIGLLYHTSQLLYEYGLGKTIVNIEISRENSDILPAITICYPYMLSFEKISKLNEYYGLYKKYQVIITKASNNYSELVDQADNLTKIYNGVMKDILDKINDGSIKLYEFLKNYSMSNRNSSGYRMITIMIDNTFYDEFEQVDHSEFDHGEQLIESFVFFKQDAMAKCFTFFSALREKWRNLRKSYKYIKIIINYDINQFPFHREEQIIPFALHSQNTMPKWQGENFDYLPLGKAYLI